LTRALLERDVNIASLADALSLLCLFAWRRYCDFIM